MIKESCLSIINIVLLNEPIYEELIKQSVSQSYENDQNESNMLKLRFLLLFIKEII